MNATTPPGIGHNNPPEPLTPEKVQRDLLAANADLTKRRDELTLTQARLPKEITDADTAGKLGDHIRSLGTLVTNADAARKSAKAPFVALEDAVDGFFAQIIDPVAKLKKKALALQKVWLDAEAARVAREAADEAKRLREEAAAKAAAAEKAEAERIAAEKERERIRQEEEAAFKAALAADQRAQEAAAAAKKAADDEEAAKKAAAAKAEADAALRTARAKSAEEASASAVVAAAEKAEKLAEGQLDRAVSLERTAARIERDVETGRPADFARTRGLYGSVSTLQRQWFVEITDRKTLDLEALRTHLPADALEQAARSFVKAGGRELKGARIWEDTVAQAR